MESIRKRVPASGNEVSAWLAQLLGSTPDPLAGRVHVCSSWRHPDGTLRAIRIGEHAPAGPTDALMLRAARAQADAIVTSGRIVRNEPELDHSLGADPEATCLHAYRRSLGKASAPLTLVLSHSGELPAEHPLWDDWTRVVVWTPAERVQGLREKLPAQVEVHPAQGEGLEPALAFLAEVGAARVSLEIGPRAVAPLYAAGLVDELWASRFEGGELPEPARGGAWPFDDAQLERWSAGAGERVQEESGQWCFGRYLPEGR